MIGVLIESVCACVAGKDAEGQGTTWQSYATTLGCFAMAGTRWWMTATMRFGRVQPTAPIQGKLGCENGSGCASRMQDEAGKQGLGCNVD